MEKGDPDSSEDIYWLSFSFVSPGIPIFTLPSQCLSSLSLLLHHHRIFGLDMNAYASTSTSTRAPHHARTSSSGSNQLFWDIVGSAMYPIGQEQLQYDSRGRLLPFVETHAQRRERERLLRRKEHARRVNKWLEESSMEAAKVSSTEQC